jgi:hypothetical protein
MLNSGIRDKKKILLSEKKILNETKNHTNSDIQNTTQKTKPRATRTPLKTGMNSGVPAPLVASAMLLLFIKNILFTQKN